MRIGGDSSARGGRIVRAAVLVCALGAVGACTSGLPNASGGAGWARGPGLGNGGVGPTSLFRSFHDRMRRPPSEPEGESGGGSETLTVAVVSDLNGRYGSEKYNDHVHDAVDWITGRLQPDLVLSTGDHVAGQREGLDYGAMWQAFHRTVTEPVREAGIPFAPTPGNHDAARGEPYKPERRRYIAEWEQRRPSVQFDGSGNYPLYYAFEKGPALFVSLDVTVPGPLPDEQMEWLESVLERHDDKAAKIVFAHLPLVPFAENRENEIIGDPALEDLLDEHGVDAMLSGHHHAYYPGRRGDIKMIGMACLGGGPRELIGRDRRSRQSALLMKISPDGGVRVRAKRGPEMQQEVDRTELPRSISHDGWTTWRLGAPRPLADRRE